MPLANDELEKLADLITDRILVQLEKKLSSDRHVDICELAKIAKVSQSTLFRLKAAGKLIALKVGGALRFNLQRALAELAAVSKEA